MISVAGVLPAPQSHPYHVLAPAALLFVRKTTAQPNGVKQTRRPPPSLPPYKPALPPQRQGHPPPLWGVLTQPQPTVVALIHTPVQVVSALASMQAWPPLG